MNVVELQVNKRSYRVDSVPSEASLKEVILEKVHSGEREVCVWMCVISLLGKECVLHKACRSQHVCSLQRCQFCTLLHAHKHLQHCYGPMRTAIVLL